MRGTEKTLRPSVASFTQPLMLGVKNKEIKMNWKIFLLITISILFIGACGNQDSESNDQSLISSSNIQHLQIIKDNGNVPSGEERFVEYDYEQNELSVNAVQFLDEITTTTEDLYCSNDGVTYEINITDFDDEVFTYVSNNRDCGRDNESFFISVDDIENLILILE